MFFAHLDSKWDPKQLFIRSDWEPDSNELPPEFRVRVSCFLTTVASTFQRHKVVSNLTRQQEYLLSSLQQSKDFVVFPSNKNLEPCTIEHEEYIQRVFSDHLLDDTTYQQLSKAEAEAEVDSNYSKIDEFLVDN